MSRRCEAFDQHGPLVLGMARKLVGADAEDVAQQVFLAAWKARERYDADRGPLGAWLVGITRFKAIDHLRAKSRQLRTVDDEFIERSGANEPYEESLASRLADRMVLTEALSILPDERREIVKMSFYDGLTHCEICERTGIPLGTIKSHVRRGLLAMRDHLDRARLDPDDRKADDDRI
ncbi:MAG: sigma-70 family RNA polymerase sigma factor [Acidimicrobiales bacterium]